MAKSVMKTFDDFCADQRKIDLDKKILDTPVGNVMYRTLDDLFKGDWKKCPKSLKEFILNYDTSDLYYANITTFVEDYFLDQCGIKESQYEKIMNWMQEIKIIVYWPER